MENVKCHYGRRTALDIDTLELPGEELLCITGANGAGKSTLLELLAMLKPARTGTLWFAGERVPTRGRSLRVLR
ncbi:MAG: ATP-binding cassette domain-containing protein, partial [Desulfuromonadales bacterium]|nr:ATP-binding cassette domain-containing protein [Desulfuromonadales bacterium]